MLYTTKHRVWSPIHNLLGGKSPQSPRKKGMNFMYEFLFFIIGTLIGGLFGVAFMCLFQINKQRKDDEK